VPASYISTPKEAAFVSSAPSPEQNIVDELSRQAREANQAEQEVLNQALSPASATSPAPAAPAQQTPGPTEGPATVSLGQSPAEVESILGRPKQAFDVGPKKIYVYKDLKITFLDGKVSDVQ